MPRLIAIVIVISHHHYPIASILRYSYAMVHDVVAFLLGLVLCQLEDLRNWWSASRTGVVGWSQLGECITYRNTGVVSIGEVHHVQGWRSGTIGMGQCTRYRDRGMVNASTLDIEGWS